MWVFLNDSFLSIVSHRRKDMLLVRGRRAEDISVVFPDATVSHTPQRDYAYRAIIKRKTVQRVMAAEVDRINYDNFKNSVEDNERHDAYAEIWTTMMRWSRGAFARRPYRNDDWLPLSGGAATGPLKADAPWMAGDDADEEPPLTKGEDGRWRTHELPLENPNADAKP